MPTNKNKQQPVQGAPDPTLTKILEELNNYFKILNSITDEAIDKAFNLGKEVGNKEGYKNGVYDLEKYIIEKLELYEGAK